MTLTQPEISDSSHSLTLDRERSLLEQLRATELSLDAALLGANIEVEPRDDARAHLWRKAVERALARVRRPSDPALDEARALLKASQRILWCLALSGMPQVEHLLLRLRYTNVSREELRQAGVMGLYRAACRFQADREVRFSTYCRFWVRDAMGECIGTLRFATRLPSKARRQLRQPVESLSRGQVQALENVRSAVSLDAPTQDDGSRYGDLAADSHTAAPDAALSQKRELEQLEHALQSASLSDRDRHVLTHRFGLQGAPVQSYRQLGEALGVSGERVRQLNVAAVAKVRRACAA